jgi:hypothetical protein
MVECIISNTSSKLYPQLLFILGFPFARLTVSEPGKHMNTSRCPSASNDAGTCSPQDDSSLSGKPLKNTIGDDDDDASLLVTLLSLVVVFLLPPLSTYGIRSVDMDVDVDDMLLIK